MEGPGSAAGLAEAVGWIDQAQAVVVLTGAGISTGSGIPDYRGPLGTWTRNPEAERMATIDHYLADAEVRKRSWQGRRGSPIWGAQPNDGHRALVHLEGRGKLSLLVTQNVDGLHGLAGTAPERLIEIHGSARSAGCWSCGDVQPMAEVLERVEAGEEDPRCRLCGGIIKSTTVMFGQSLVAADLMKAEAAARSCDLMLAVGTKLTVGPVCELVPVARASGARVVIVNNEPTAYDHLAHAVLRGDISDQLPALVRAERGSARGPGAAEVAVVHPLADGPVAPGEGRAGAIRGGVAE
ncbi:MAG TPA: Sir2 family NAD-dependent protein deacetylase [Acidimicrobiales bacterium]|nr:Sir2 family NAD-dependent protein deacetylase [Acidimicrobiales bacterium]